jgi:hypothetical protein
MPHWLLKASLNLWHNAGMEETLMSKYDPLHRFFCRAIQKTVTMTFGQMEGVLGFALPKTAKKREQWWANETVMDTRHVQCKAWMSAGFHAHPNLTAQTVTFSKA